MVSLHPCTSCGVAASSKMADVAVTHRRTGEKAVLWLCATCRNEPGRTWRLVWIEDE
jgi:hypothetical protein